jgi:hypothetical protein
VSEFSWLPNSLLKDIELPKIYWEVEADQYYGGYYNNENKYMVIVENENQYLSTIAHEFMHHLQNIQGRKIDNIFHFGKLSYRKMSYEDQIKKYFRTNPDEYEALLFENKMVKTDLNDWWLRRLVHEKD